MQAFLEEKLEMTLTREITEEMDEKAKAEFKLKDAKAKSIIIQCVTDKHLDVIKDALTAKQMITSLEEVFNRKSVFTKLSLKRKLLTMKCKLEEKLEDHFMKFDAVIRELDSIRSKMEEEDKVCHLLLSLPEDFNPVITAVETLRSTVTIEFVKSRLLDEEMKLKSKGNMMQYSENNSCLKAHQVIC